MKTILTQICLSCLLTIAAQAATIAYIHGDVGPHGEIPSGSADAFHMMMPNDSGKLGISEFAEHIESEGHTLVPVYDAATTLDANFLSAYDAIIFGLHQKEWSAAEHKALHRWLEAGGRILMYSDSASGGHHKHVGLKNDTGQKAVNSILANYGLQVAVDQGGGTRSYRSAQPEAHPISRGDLILEGEGVSPIAVDPNAQNVTVIYAFNDALKVEGSGMNDIDRRGITLPAEAELAALVAVKVGEGSILALFDRQPLWNDGPGSSIRRADNREIMHRIVSYMTR